MILLMHHLAWGCRFNGLITVINTSHNFSKFPWRGSQTSSLALPTKSGHDKTIVSLIWLPGGMDSKGVWDEHIPTVIKWITSKDLLMEFCSMLCGNLNGRGAWGRIDSWVPSLFTCNYHNIVNQLYPNTKEKVSKEKKDYSESDTSIVKNEIDICHNK